MTGVETIIPRSQVIKRNNFQHGVLECTRACYNAPIDVTRKVGTDILAAEKSPAISIGDCSGGKYGQCFLIGNIGQAI